MSCRSKVRQEITAFKDGLSQTNRFLISIAACVASGKWRLFRHLIDEALAEKVPMSRIYEVILQSYLFLGYPKALEGMKIFREVCDNTYQPSNINYSFRYWSEWKIRGIVLCEKVYGKNFDMLMKRVKEISPELSDWMIVEGYGKVLSRGVLAGVIRELCNVAVLLVTSDINQLHSHIRGAKNLGAGKTDIKAAIEIAGQFCAKRKLNRGLKLFNAIFEE
jgi:4-carboxymuconolactone decarboxylase